MIVQSSTERIGLQTVERILNSSYIKLSIIISTFCLFMFSFSVAGWLMPYVSSGVIFTFLSACIVFCMFGAILQSDNAPLGTVIAYCGKETPYGYLLCDGSDIDQALHFKLVQVIGSTKLPDLRGVYLRGASFRKNRDDMKVYDQGHYVGQEEYTVENCVILGEKQYAKSTEKKDKTKVMIQFVPPSYNVRYIIKCI